MHENADDKWSVWKRNSGGAMQDAYEQQRKRNIQRNEAELDRLGIDRVHEAPLPAKKTQKRRLKAPAEPRVGERSSQRIRQEPANSSGAEGKKESDAAAGGAARYKTERLIEAPDWLNDVFEEEGARPRGSPCWDPKRMHQHLELSKSKGTVCTTGHQHP